MSQKTSVSSTLSQITKIRLVRAYMAETDRICKEDYAGDWDKMPEPGTKLPIRWNQVINKARIQTTPAGAAALVRAAINDDALMELVEP